MQQVDVEELRAAVGEKEAAKILQRIQERRTEELVAGELARQMTQLVRSKVREGDLRGPGGLEMLRRFFREVDLDDQGEIVVGFRADDTSSRARTNRRPRKSGIGRTQEREFRRPILEILVEKGGSYHATDLRPILGQKMKEKLTEADLEAIPSTGEPRWWNTAKWERKTMTRHDPPLLETTSRHGWWEITAAGREYLAAHQED